MAAVCAFIAELVELRSIAAWDADRAMKLVSEFQRFFAEAAERGEDVLAALSQTASRFGGAICSTGRCALPSLRCCRLAAESHSGLLAGPGDS